MTAFMIQVRFVFTWPRILLINRPSKNSVGFPSISLLVSTSSHDLVNAIGQQESDSPECCFDFCCYYGNHNHLEFGDPMTPIVFRLPRSVVAVLMWVLAYTEEWSQSSSRMLGLPSQIYSKQWWWKGCPLDPPRMDEQVLNDKSTLTF